MFDFLSVVLTGEFSGSMVGILVDGRCYCYCWVCFVVVVVVVVVIVVFLSDTDEGGSWSRSIESGAWRRKSGRRKKKREKKPLCWK